MGWISYISAIHYEEKVVKVPGALTVDDIKKAAASWGLSDYTVLDNNDLMRDEREFPLEIEVWLESIENSPISPSP